MAEYSAVELANRFEEMVDVLNRMPSVVRKQKMIHWPCLLYTTNTDDEQLSEDLG